MEIKKVKEYLYLVRCHSIGREPKFELIFDLNLLRSGGGPLA